MGLFDSLFRSSEVLGIARETLEFALQASEQTHPDEYMGMLRGTEAREVGLDRDGLVITDVLVIPGTESNSVSATVKTNMIPNDNKSLGSVHSHPNGALRPSKADLATFTRGDVHIIIGAPYGRTDWKAFDSDGQPTELNVLDVDLPDDDEFFHFDQHDIDAELREDEFDRGRRW
ncbi:Mov34/MPN/PAD-1 family protein [Natranaeroarchaeum aerophilus]|uniref:Mov34/MPN/PAD-1 family protein n=1 Tax=Natranaeroarchaeum aerophilus TaxID=2917711 RepID=A0AAE3FU24_9EURY|nr:Mov34/MPN/PAD-1 family protein [Natranaeroarchaeum aerophilus]MCL9814938.1 Mov34/MPN/PAD-1 family protein [Natranaeroarchaeum aerophilus]